jgi:hypothetical protein
MKKIPLKRIYHHYEKWEDWRNGMYSVSPTSMVNQLVDSAKNLLNTTSEFYYIASKVISDWTNSCEQNLTNRNRNRQAYIGQASCCFNSGTPENLTKLAWHQLSSTQQNEANAIADKIILKWEKTHAQNLS